MRATVLLGAIALSTSAWAQSTLHGVWVLNEGFTNGTDVLEPVTLGHYDPMSGEYMVIDEIEGASFANDLLVTEQGVYVVAQSQVLRYDRDSGALLASVALDGARQLALLEDRIYVTRGDFDAVTWEPIEFDAYLVWFDALTLEWEGELTVDAGPQFASEGIVAVDGNVFVAVGNAFDFGNEVGLIGRLDPQTGEYLEWDLGANGSNPVHLMERDGALFSVNNGDWSHTSVSRLDAAAGEPLTVSVNASASGCMAAALVNDHLAFQVSGEAQVRSFGLEALTEEMPLLATSIGFYAMEQDPVSGQIYASETDWFSYGQVHIFSPEGEALSTFDAGISPVAIGMDVRSASGVSRPHREVSQVQYQVDASGRLLDARFPHTGVVIDVHEDGFTRKHWTTFQPR